MGEIIKAAIFGKNETSSHERQSAKRILPNLYRGRSKTTEQIP